MRWHGKDSRATQNVANKIEEEILVGLSLPQVAKEEPTSSPDMPIKVEQSLTMPCQKDERRKQKLL